MEVAPQTDPESTRADSSRVQQPSPKMKDKADSATKKTIKAHGSAASRTAQACDRCRAKKSRCDGKLPACSSCAAVGIKCIVSDKLSRRAFPKGYTETLEERVRQLEAENTKLSSILALRDEQLALNGAPHGKPQKRGKSPDPSSVKDDDSANLQSPDLSNPHSVLHSHIHGDACPCCSNPHTFHDRPVSIAGSIYNGGAENVSVPGSVFSDDDDGDTSSLLSIEGYLNGSGHPLSRDYGLNNNEARPAPGAFAAATAIEQMQKQRNSSGYHINEESKQQILTGLVAASIPRSTEETLFIPTLLARVCQVYGYGSAPAKLTASALASLKEMPSLPAVGHIKDSPRQQELLSLIMDKSQPELELTQAVRFLSLLQLPLKVELDYLLTVYFQEWGNVFPIVNKNAFLKNYSRLFETLETGVSTTAPAYCYESLEKLGAVVVLVSSLASLSKKFTHMQNKVSPESVKYSALLTNSDQLIHEFIKPNCMLTRFCSLQSLQILSLALLYCLATGDFATCYELRGRVITMAQQLRLHRCPAAVLGMSKVMNDRNLQNFMQGERRILFWCIYSLDAYASLNLGVPRLLKDHEIECAMPFSGKNDDDSDEKNNENILIINNTKLTIFGRVSRIALSVMQYSKVLGNIMDSIFSRSGNDDVQETALEKDQVLDCWRRGLPVDLKFEIDVNGFSLKDPTNSKLNGGGDGTNWNVYSKQQLLLIFLYYHAKILIYLPIISKFGYHHNVGLSMKEKLAIGSSGDISTNVSSMTSIQQSAIQILELFKALSSEIAFLVPVPSNIPREQARFAILVAKGSLDYIKGGPLYQQSKQLLLDTLAILKRESDLEIPGSLTRNSASVLEYAILSVLGMNYNKSTIGNSLRRRIINNGSFSGAAVARDFQYSSSYAPPRDEQTTGFTTDTQIRLPSFPQENSQGLKHNYDHQNANQGHVKMRQTSPYDSSDFVGADSSTTVGSSILASSSNNNSQSSEPFSTPDQNPDVDEELRLEEFIMDYNNEIMNNEFVTDGSLGLVPFLNDMSQEYEEDRLSDRADEGGAISVYKW